MIYVTKTFLPPQEEYQAILKKAWDDNWITNRGKLVLQLENKLKEYLNVKNIIATTNGTLPLQIAAKTLNLQGEILTTPFSYVATTSSIVWEGCTPVFVDIDPDYLTIDETKIESAITSNTSAILATHVFGNPCNIEKIAAIAAKNNLKIIYDAAHCFGVSYKDHSIFGFGDVSTCSFHATKLFHTAEGGALFTNSSMLNKKLFYHHNFGHDGPEDFQGLGINAKMSELQAALGLSILPYMSAILSKRKEIYEAYVQALGGKFKFIKIRAFTKWNYSYCPIIFDDEKQLLQVKSKLEKQNIYPRRYFYPSLNKLPYVTNKNLPISDSISTRILCLPMYNDLDRSTINKITSIILS